MSEPTEQLFSLRQVVELTGVSEFTLRGWENRYAAFQPKRTPSGRRLYGKTDVLRSRALLELTARGHRIGAIAKLPIGELHQLLTGTEVAPEPQPESTGSLAAGRVIVSAKDYQWVEVASGIETARARRTPFGFIFDFLLPLLGKIREAVEAGHFSIAQEHILSSYIKESLHALRPPRRRIKPPMRLVFAAPEGDFHEIGLLVANTLAKLHGFDRLYLGPNMPKADLCQTCLRADATHLLLVTTLSQVNGAKEDIFQLIHFLDRQLGPQVELWVAGPNSANLNLSLQRPFQILGRFEELDRNLRQLLNRPAKKRRLK